MYIKVRVQPAAKKEMLACTDETHLKIAVKEPAKHNLANRRVVALVAAHFKVPAGRVRIVSGHRSPSKILSVDIDK